VYIGAHGRILRCNRDGTDRIDAKTVYTIQALTVNRDGIIGTAHGHLSHSARLWTPAFQEIIAFADFPTEPRDPIPPSPCDIQAGASGDFYICDPTRNQIRRITPEGRLRSVISIAAAGENYKNRQFRLRVIESLQRLYLLGDNGVLHAVELEAPLAEEGGDPAARPMEVKPLWTVNTGAGRQDQYLDPWCYFGADFDADEDGDVYVLKINDDTVTVYGADGGMKETIQLKGEDPKGIGLSLRYWQGELFVKRQHPAEMFRVYDRKTGELKRVVMADQVRFKVEIPSEIWLAGQPVAMAMMRESAGKAMPASWPVRISRFNDPEWIDLPLAEGKVVPPADASGLYRLRVDAGECRLATAIEIRVPHSKGTVNILTPLNRVYYGQGEEIPLKVILRSSDKPPAPIALKLVARADGSEVLAIAPQAIQWQDKIGTSALSTQQVAAIRPGRYLVTADVPGFTVVPQNLVIGPGNAARAGFFITEYLDGAGAQCWGNWKNLPESVAALIQRTRKIGHNLFVDYGNAYFQTETEAIQERLKKDPLGVAPEKAEMEEAERQALAAYSAYGLERMHLLCWVDTTAPQPDMKTHLAALEQACKSVREASAQWAVYPGFRGWSWFQHYWVIRDNILDAAEKA
ncbi:MAG: hypothetical protein N3A66_06820, partial [Planctomycetota bacterium]|nr:hypothetical protein [Planctomycetota bacterium]